MHSRAVVYAASPPFEALVTGNSGYAGSPILSPREQYHSLVSVEGGLHSCHQCTYVTKYRTHMQRHLSRHTGKRPFPCHLCPASFVQNTDLRHHIRIHTGERPFSCVHCNLAKVNL
ncbi:hypothetical protein HPB51_019164 [Rhipicephalus microplus]|uniref:C2H2-type domain-containing protein n=1 Tax=Rhipicephalus microplus TaxID=6941 RepID=A0A9J6EBB8_RHIMP|nr:hypothetical protein HPB51_019164 [Rhipicephalus microplus]